jgi:hypothetical protein
MQIAEDGLLYWYRVAEEADKRTVDKWAFHNHRKNVVGCKAVGFEGLIDVEPTAVERGYFGPVRVGRDVTDIGVVSLLVHALQCRIDARLRKEWDRYVLAGLDAASAIGWPCGLLAARR